MAVTPYNPVNWTKGPVSVEKLQRMADNDQWLFENTPRMIYRGTVNRSEGLRVAAGRTWYTTRAESWNSVTVNFGSFFTAGCRPAIVTTCNPLNSWHHMFTAIGGIGEQEPDHRGFVGYVMCDIGALPNNKMMGSGGYLNWVAVGY